MLQFDRIRLRREVYDGAGNSCALISDRLSITVGRGTAGFGGIYEHPVAVERDGVVTAITDVVVVVRLAGLLAVTLAVIVGVIRT